MGSKMKKMLLGFSITANKFYFAKPKPKPSVVGTPVNKSLTESLLWETVTLFLGLSASV
jgi:hypothetical protein